MQWADLDADGDLDLATYRRGGPALLHSSEPASRGNGRSSLGPACSRREGRATRAGAEVMFGRDSSAARHPAGWSTGSVQRTNDMPVHFGLAT